MRFPLILNEAEVNLVLAGLGELQAKTGAGTLMLGIKNACDQQIAAAQQAEAAAAARPAEEIDITVESD